MTALSSVKDAELLRLTLVAHFNASPERVECLGGPTKARTLVGPPYYPATFTRHDFSVGGESRYYMTGPNGDTPHGWWRVTLLDKPSRLEFDNGLAGDDGEPRLDVAPTPSFVTFESVAGGTRMTGVTNFTSVAQMEMMLAMGMQEGVEQALGQIDVVLSSAAV